jgi:uncharacterized phage-associated protein
MASVTAIAEWIVRYRADNGAPIDRVSLQKMLFYAQAFRLARHGEPLFRGRFEAWVHGPVVPEIWRQFGNDGAHLVEPDERRSQPQIDSETEQCLRDVVDFFSLCNPFMLSRATHEEDPWREARGDRPGNQRSEETIPIERIKTYYAALIEDGEEAFSRH